MSLSAPFIARPVATTLLTLGVMLAGILGFVKLPVAPLPKVDFPTILVTASLPGASPDTVATSVTTPLERRLGAIAGVTEITSTSTVGNARIVLQFDLSRSIDGAARDVQAAINAARVDLPTDLRSQPAVPQGQPGRCAGADPGADLRDARPGPPLRRGLQRPAAEAEPGDRRRPGHAGRQLAAGGAGRDQPDRAVKYRIGLESVRAALAAANANSPKGALEVGDRRWQLYTNDQSRTAAEYRPLIIAWRNGAPVRLSDVAEVIDATEDIRNEGQANGKRSVLCIIYLQPNANIIETVDEVKALLPELQAALPNDVDLMVASDRTTTIRASLKEVEHALIASVILVVLVTFAFLRSLRAGLVPSVAVPVSLVGTFGVMYLMGYSLNNLSLMAMAIAAGFVVDDAIIVLENIQRHIEDGMPRMQAALLGAREVGFTVVSMSLSLIAVFIPILLMGGIVGRLFREFAVTLSIAIVISMVVSLTTTPMMCAYILKPPRRPDEGGEAERPPGRLARASRARLRRRCRTSTAARLRVVLRHPRLTMIVFLGTDHPQHLPVRGDPQGLLPAAGHRPHHRRHPRRPEHLLPVDAAEVPPVRRHHPRGSGDRERGRLHRRLPDQFGLPVRHPEAARRAQGQRRPGDRAPAAQARAGARRQRLPAGDAGHPGRRPPGQLAVPVHPAERFAARSLYLGAEARRGAAAATPR